MDIYVLIILTFEAVLSVLLIYSTKSLKNTKDVFITSILIFISFALRFSMLNHKTYDYLDFLTKWVSYFRDNGGFSALSNPIGNYNIPYLYILAAISYSDITDLYLIKLTSIFFDILLSYSCALIVSSTTHNKIKTIFSFIAVLFIPTVILNSAYWAQCDSIYTAFSILGIYFALSKKPRLSIIMFAISFSFKLQAVFILPVIFIFIIDKKIKPKHLLWFPTTYFLLLLPALLLGLPLSKGIFLYFNQVGSVGSALNYNSSSIFSIISFPSNDQSFVSKISIIITFVLIILIYTIHLVLKGGSSKKTEVAITCLFSIMIPFFLPHMHDRYFFPADVLSVVMACISPKLFILPLLVEFGSFLGYYAYLQGAFILPMKFGGETIALALLICLCFYMVSLKPSKIK